MRHRTAAAALALTLVAGIAARAQTEKKDYLTDTEADKIRDAQTPAIRIKLYVSFAADRIQKLKYELAHPADSNHRAERINGLINGYGGCMDDAADLIDLGVDKQQDIRDGIKALQAQAPDFLAYLKELRDKGHDLDDYKDNLDDAIDATTDAMKTADDAAAQLAPPPVRRKP